MVLHLWQDQCPGLTAPKTMPMISATRIASLPMPPGLKAMYVPDRNAVKANPTGH